ncbi:MAG: ribonuclease HII [Candidatus Nomurabacteria bacterium]|nr:MAG: ribonuclease HII [Candidatus Nomurabacteria bacterium]
MARQYLRSDHEQKLWQQGYQAIVGLDEAGRGALAGPIVAGAVIFHPGTHIEGIHDSKVLSPKARAERYEEITSQAKAWSVGVVSHRAIDQRGIAYANRQAFVLALQGLSLQPDYILSDAFPVQQVDIPYQAIIDGDAKVFSIAAASIIAKVYRDNLLCQADKKWPVYGFAQHKGYGTAAHIDAIQKHGVAPFHRKSFIHIES